MSQNATIRTHLKVQGSITFVESWTYYRISRLAARISDLRDSGMDIKTVLVPNKSGKGTHAKYILEDKK